MHRKKISLLFVFFGINILQIIIPFNKPGTAQVGAISKAQKDSKTTTTFSTTGDNKSSQKTEN